MSSSHSPRTSLKRKLSSELSEGVASRALQDRQDAWRRKIEELVGNLNDALYGEARVMLYEDDSHRLQRGMQQLDKLRNRVKSLRGRALKVQAMEADVQDLSALDAFPDTQVSFRRERSILTNVCLRLEDNVRKDHEVIDAFADLLQRTAKPINMGKLFDEERRKLAHTQQ